MTTDSAKKVMRYRTVREEASKPGIGLDGTSFPATYELRAEPDMSDGRNPVYKEALAQATGTRIAPLGLELIRQAQLTSPMAKQLGPKAEAVAASLTEPEPKDAIEGMLVVQLTALHNQMLFHFDQQRFVTGELEADSYKRLRSHTLSQIEQLKLDVQELEVADTAFEKYNRYGMSLITHMDTYFAAASLEVKRKMLGSIFPGKLTF